MKMTRFLSLTLALLLTLALFTTAMAANENGNSAAFTLHIAVVTSIEPEMGSLQETWYLEYAEDQSFDWGTQTQTINPIGSVEWDVDKGVYNLNPTVTFEAAPKTLKVTNKSNFDVAVKATAPGVFVAEVDQEKIAWGEAADVTVSINGDKIPEADIEYNGNLTITFTKDSELYQPVGGAG